jgi:hypothetical protein
MMLATTHCSQQVLDFSPSYLLTVHRSQLGSVMMCRRFWGAHDQAAVLHSLGTNQAVSQTLNVF